MNLTKEEYQAECQLFEAEGDPLYMQLWQTAIRRGIIQIGGKA